MLCSRVLHVLTAFALVIYAFEVAEKCPLTRVNVYKYRCGVKGALRLPDKLRDFHTDSLKKCAAACFDLEACESFSLRKDRSNCVLYQKVLDHMDFDPDNFFPGEFYNRECFSTDCNVINACEASRPCHKEVEGYHVYRQFACSYGHTSRLRVRRESSYFAGTLESCEAIKLCAERQIDGTWDVHYLLDAQMWECNVFYSKANSITNPTAEEQKVSWANYRHANSSIGAGYGFWFEAYKPRY